MTKNECKNIIKNEGLNNYNWFDEHEFRSEEVCIRKVKNKTVVFTLSERCCPVSESIMEFDDESLALQEFIKRLRADRVILEYNKKS